MKSAGLTHGSFYNHFQSKTDLINACIDHGAAKSLSDLDDASPTESGRRAYVAEYLSVAHRDDPGSGCLISALGSEVRRQPMIQGAMTRFIHAYINKLAHHFPWANSRRARRDSIRLTASLVGGVVLARAVNDQDLSAEILREVAQGIRDSFRLT
jgi:TetR/AcrR family transcriptional repressor of nem operon